MDQIDFDFEELNKLTGKLNYPLQLSSPRCKTTINNVETGERFNQSETAGCNLGNLNYELSEFISGTYSISVELWDQEGNNKLGQDSQNFTIKEPELPLLLIGIGVVVVLLLVIVIGLALKRKNN